MPRGRGRPPLSGRRGRPRSVPAAPAVDTSEGGTPVKRRRGPGRPPRSERQVTFEKEDEEELEELLKQEISQTESASDTEEEQPVRKRKKSVGRPRRKSFVEEPDEDGLISAQLPIMDDDQSFGLHMTTMQVRALSQLVACRDCGESVNISVRPTTKGMISEFVVTCIVCEAKKVTITPNLVRERKRKREIKGLVLQKTENINYAHVAAFLDNGLGYSGLRHYCKYFNARCLNEATFIVYSRQVIQDVVNDTEDNLQSNARIVRKVYGAGSDEILDITVSYTTTYHQWGSDFCLVAGAVIELQTGLVLDYDVANMYCHVCKINAKRIISMTPTEMTHWFNKHQSSCEIREWCDELDHDADEGVKDIEPKYLECFVAKKIWSRSVEKFGFRYSTLIHESDETIHSELLRSAPYGDHMVMIDNMTNCFSRRKSEHARTAFQNKLKSKCPRERVQTKDRIMYVYAMSIPEYNRFAVGSNIKLRELVRRMEIEEAEQEGFTLQVLDTLPTIQAHEVIAADGETSEVIYTHEEEVAEGFEEQRGEEDEEQQMQEAEEPEEMETETAVTSKAEELLVKKETLSGKAAAESKQPVPAQETASSSSVPTTEPVPSSSGVKVTSSGVMSLLSRTDPTQIIVLTATKAVANVAKTSANGQVTTTVVAGVGGDKSKAVSDSTQETNKPSRKPSNGELD